MVVIKKLWQATLYSLAGLKAAYKYQWPFRVEIMVLVATLPLSFLVGVTLLQRILLIGSVLLVMIVELLNSAVETVVDRISMEKNELSGRAKDLGSAAVFVACVHAVIVWIFIFCSNFF